MYKTDCYKNAFNLGLFTQFYYVEVIYNYIPFRIRTTVSC